MCITSLKAMLQKTKILSFRKDDGNIYLAYSNTFRNLSGKKNVMLLPVPGEVRGEWLYDTTAYNNYLNEISRQTLVSEAYSWGIRSRGMKKSALRSAEHRTVGQYEIYFSKDFDVLHKTLTEQGVEVSNEMIEFFNEHYHGFTLVACVFDGDKRIDAQPIALEYKPLNDEFVFFPTMDSHDGSIPRHTDMVHLDHHIICENTDTEDKGKVNFSQEVPEFIKEKAYGTYELDFRDGNGDIYAKETYRPNLLRSYHNLVREKQTN